MKNLGPVSIEWLRAIGVNTKEDLEQVGSIEAYQAIRLHGFNPSLNLLYALEGAIRNVYWNILPNEVKTRLKTTAKNLPSN